MTVINKIIHRFVRNRADYEENGELYYKIIPYNVQAYSYELKENGDPENPEDYIIRYVLGTGNSTYLEIASGHGIDKDGNEVPELSKEFILSSESQLRDFILNIVKEDLGDKVDHFKVLPEPTAKDLGWIVQYIGLDTADYKNGLFYKVVSETVIDPETGEEVTVYKWEKVDTTDLSETVEKTHDPLKVYGTDEYGRQVAYDKEDFGKVDDVLVDEVSVVENKIAHIDLTGKVDKTDEALRVYGTDEYGNQTTFNVNAFGKIEDVQLNGVSVVTDKIANLEPEAADIAYTNEQYPSMQTLQDAMDKLLYVEPTVNISGGSERERGESVSSVTVNWTWNKKITSQKLSITGESDIILDPTIRTYTYTPASPITTNKTFTISGTDGTTAKSKSTSVTFIIKKYYGATTLEDPTDAQFRALTAVKSEKGLSSTQFNFGTGKYWYYVLPVETYNKTDLVFSIGPAGSEALQSGNYFIYRKDDFKNAQGVTIPVTVYKFKKTPAGLPDMLTGTANVKVA